MKGIVAGMVIIALLLAVLYCVFWLPGTFFCSMRWSGSGFDTRYGFFSGCQINSKGRWIPERAFREI